MSYIIIQYHFKAQKEIIIFLEHQLCLCEKSTWNSHPQVGATGLSFQMECKSCTVLLCY